MQTVEQLPLVFMDPLHLDVKQGAGIDLHLIVFLQMGGKLHLVLLRCDIVEECYAKRSLALAVSSSHLFDFGDVPNEGVIVYKVQKPLQLVQVTDVVLTNPLKKNNGQKQTSMFKFSFGRLAF